jgi:cytoskeletal protein RodZ
MRINQQKSGSRKWYVLTAVVLLLAVGLLVGYFTWYVPSQDRENTTQTDTNVVKNTTEYTPSTELNNSLPPDSPNSDVRDLEKSPEQYDGQNAAGDTSNANCIDADCSNFTIPEGEN